MLFTLLKYQKCHLLFKIPNKGVPSTHPFLSEPLIYEGDRRSGSKTFYGMSELIFVQKLSHFEVRGFGRITYKERDKIDISRYFTPDVSAPSILVQISRNAHQMVTLIEEKILFDYPEVIDHKSFQGL